MSSAVQVQQANQAAVAAMSLGSSSSSCIQHLVEYRWHVHFGDFEEICGHKVSADCLRAFETMTDVRIAKLRESAKIPQDRMPHNDDLWIEASTPDIAYWTLHVRDQSTYWYCLQESSYPGRAKSLLELGFLRRRFVARPGHYAVAPVATTIYLDIAGEPFIIVDDDKYGYYVGFDGELHSAADEGYTVMRRQYLCCFEVINATFAKLAGQSPPAPMKRWHSLQRTKKSAVSPQETTKSTPRTSASMNSQTSAAQGCLDGEIKGVRPETVLFANKNNTVCDTLSLDLDENRQSLPLLRNNSVPLHSAPWTPETCVALSAQINHELFALPAQIDEAAYNRDWLEPAQRLIEKRCADFAEPSRAWERVELHIWAMLIGQTWYAQGRTQFTQFTLDHVERNWKTVEAELRKSSWPVYDHIEYKGPSIFDEQSAQSSSTQSYAQGYTAQSTQPAQPEEDAAHYVENTAQSLPDAAQSEQVVEVVAQVEDEAAQSDEQAMQSEQDVAHTLEVIDAQSLAMAVQTAQREEIVQGMDETTTCIVDAQIRRECPNAIIGVTRLTPGLFMIGVEYALDQWLDIASLADWINLTNEHLEQIEAYGKQRCATDGNDAYEDSQGPPGQGEASEEGGEATW